MEKINFESLRQEDLALRQREDIVRLQESAFEQIAREEKEKVIEDVREFIARCHKAGKYIADEQERDSLRAILRYWGTFVYNTSGVYPSVDLADLEISTPKMRIKFSPVSLLVAGTLVLLAGAIASLFVLRYLSARQPPTARILQPHDKDSVPYETEVSGRYEGHLAGRNLWVIVRPQGSDLYYPQRPAKIQRDKSWFVTARFGQDTPEEGGKAFDIFVYLASSQADQTLQEYVNEADRTGNWPGMPLPSGLTQLDQVRVTRQTPLIEVQILQPHDKDSVPYETVVSGRYEGNLAGRNLWVIVRPQGSDRYYPQQSAEIRGDNTWFVMARFGKDTPEESGKVFDISVYLASSQADQKLRKYVNEADKTGNWPGMPSLADGLTLLDRVTVIRR